MVTHYKVKGHLACGHAGKHLESTTELNRVKCRSCRNTDVYKEARRNARNAARRAQRKARAEAVHNDWRSFWEKRLAAMPGTQRLPRGFQDQAFVGAAAGAPVAAAA
ncbi:MULTISPECIES: hypothetical protein [Pseudomonas nitroreducens/multiresinivorans group]|uniref:Uncharacterized protein n=1 Tax=Pseudomonas multiresinivorans TaxID=95301 RepID=A0A7Z3GR77_9PSED|nr:MULTISPECIES: hypothetical protein [Pseudomonas nitroreducens/multiresinivorans group]QJP09676.1 hypothetical protein G4G71_17940 [Pseudomonas multiresinivorans]